MYIIHYYPYYCHFHYHYRFYFDRTVNVCMASKTNVRTIWIALFILPFVHQTQMGIIPTITSIFHYLDKTRITCTKSGFLVNPVQSVKNRGINSEWWKLHHVRTLTILREELWMRMKVVFESLTQCIIPPFRNISIVINATFITCTIYKIICCRLLLVGFAVPLLESYRPPGQG